MIHLTVTNASLLPVARKHAGWHRFVNSCPVGDGLRVQTAALALCSTSPPSVPDGSS